MTFKSWFSNTKRTALIATVIITIALIRCITEPLRLHYYSAGELPFDSIKPFLYGALAAAIGLMAMVFLSHFGRYRLTLLLSALTIVVLLIIKAVYLS